MSTKIYHGYRLAEDVDIFDFQDRLRAVMNPIRDRVDATWLMDHAVHAIDHADWRGNERSRMPLFEAMADFDETQRKESARGYNQASMSRKFNPHRFEASFGRDPKSGRILALLFTEKEPFVTAWKAMDEVESYGYWNNTDAPVEVSDAEWGERREAWNRVMPGFDPPVESMLTFALRSNVLDIGMTRLAHNTDDPEVRSLLLDVAPSEDGRVARVTHNAIFAAWRATMSDEEWEGMGTARLFSTVRRIHRADTTAVADVVAAYLDTHEAVLGYVLTRHTPEPVTRDIGAPINAVAQAWVASSAGALASD